MAYLKYHTQFGQEQLGGTHMLLLQKLMDMLCAENIFFSFYEQYKGILSLPYNAADKTTVEYYAPENSKVQIFYRHDDKEEYQSEVLSCVAGGVYAKSFSLFVTMSVSFICTFYQIIVSLVYTITYILRLVTRQFFGRSRETPQNVPEADYKELCPATSLITAEKSPAAVCRVIPLDVCRGFFRKVF